MLRELKNRYVGGRLFRTAITTTAAPSISAGIGADDYTSLARASAGRFSAVLKQPYRRAPIVVAALDSSSNFGGVVFQKATPTTSAVDFQIATAASSALDATANILEYGWLSSQLGFSSLQPVEASIRRTRLIWGRIESAGTIGINRGDFTVTKAGTGLYDVVFRNAFATTPLILPAAIATSGAISAVVRSKTAQGCQIATGNGSGAAADAAFYLIVVGQDIRDAHGGANAIVDVPHRNPRIVGFRVAGGTVVVNPEEVSSIGTNGTGDFTINLSRPSRRECAAIFTSLLTGGNGMKIQTHTGGSSSVRIVCTDTGGSAASSIDGYDGILIGSDDPSEY